jgi:hypothetical protein
VSKNRTRSEKTMKRPMRCIVTVDGSTTQLRSAVLSEVAVDESQSTHPWTFQSAIVDGNAVGLALPKTAIRQLELCQQRRWDSTRNWLDPVLLRINNRECATDVWETERPLPIIGHTILTLLDLVVDLQARKLIGNPAHGGEHVLELY